MSPRETTLLLRKRAIMKLAWFASPLLLAACALLASPASSQQLPPAQASALNASMVAWGQPPLSNLTTNCSSLPGVTCDASGNVVAIILPSMGLTGVISPQLANLSTLTSLDLSNNSLSGGIPPQLGNLTKLVNLNLSQNNISGLFPTFGNGSQLANVSVAGNSLTGAVGSLPPNITFLDASTNQLSNPFFSYVTSLTVLTSLNLSNNSFNGSVPDGLNNTASLKMLDLSYNSFSFLSVGPLVQLPGLMSLSLASNAFSAPNIYLANLTALTSLKTLQSLDLSDNPWNSSIPAAFGNITGLTLLDLSNCSLKNVIPPELANITGLQILSLSNNKLNGTVPPQLASVASLSSLTLANVQVYCPGTPAWGGSSCPKTVYTNNSYCVDFCTDFCTGCKNGAWSWKSGSGSLLWAVALTSLFLILSR